MQLDKIFGVLLYYRRIIALGGRIIANGMQKSNHCLTCGTIGEFA
jgi:hypothetical protein